MSSRKDPNFELGIIHVNWAGKDDVASIESARNPIPLQRAASDEIFSAEVPAYPKVDGFEHGQLAVSADIESPPQLGPLANSVSMEAVSDPATGEEWWIEKGDWKPVSSSPVAPGYHDAPSCRHGGTVLLHVGNQRCQVHFTPPGFDRKEFDELLGDFQDECWQLILSNDSYTTVPAEGESAVPGEDFIEHAREVLEATKQILDRPHRELREVQRLQRTSRVQPVPRTFKEIAAKGWPRKVTGRSHRPDYNTPENQYVASIIERLLRAIHSLRRGGQARRKRINREISRMEQRIDEMRKGVTPVEPSRLENLADREEERVEKWRRRAENLFPIGRRRGDQVEEGRVVFRVNSQPNTKYGNALSFYVEVLEGLGRLTTLEDHLFRFGCDFANTDFFEEGNTYEACISFQLREQRDQSGSQYARWMIRRVADVDIVRSKRLREARHLRKEAEKIRSDDNEKKKVSLQRRWEREEQKRERQSLQRRKRFYNQIRSQWTDRLQALHRLERDLSAMRRQLKQIGIESSLRARYPGTMVFVQHPAYRAAHAAYQDLQDGSGFREDLFDKLLSLDDLSILDLPTVYERWSLLQIIRVLKEYGFKPIAVDGGKKKPYPSWRKDMIDTVCQTSEKAFKIHLHSSRLCRAAALTYQAELQNGKRPDFLLEVYGRNRNGCWLEGVRVVLDAKFKQFKSSENGSKEGGLGDEIDWLVNEKDYAEREAGRSNAVFVLHPAKDVVPTPATSQRWATDSYYGGEKAFDWQDGLPKHQHGGVLLRPRRHDDIKRLIAMVLSYHGEDNHGVYKYQTDQIKQKLFCLVCGGTNIDQIQTDRAKNSKGYWYRCSNDQCRHFMVLHYCRECGHRLWKHGSHWTFHDTHPLSPYNIKCPECGAYAPVSKESDES